MFGESVLVAPVVTPPDSPATNLTTHTVYVLCVGCVMMCGMIESCEL